MEKMYNVMEQIIFEKVKDLIISGNFDCCTCAKCQLDVAAIALNTTPPKYVVTIENQMYSKISTLRLQTETDVTFAILRALPIVKASPRHCSTPE